MTRRPKLVESFSGVRGPYGPEGVDEALAGWYAGCYGQWLRRQCGCPPAVAIGRDPRPSGPALAQALAEALAKEGCTVQDWGLVTTPILDFGVREGLVDAGLMVTGSHCPAPENGFKFFNPKVYSDPHGGGLLRPSDMAFLIQKVQAAEGRGPQSTGAGTVVDRYLDFALSFSWFGPGLDGEGVVEAIRQHVQRSGLTVVADPNGGAACVLVEKVLTRLGFERGKNLILVGEKPGDFQRDIEPNEATLQATIRRLGNGQQWHLGFGWDGDADRVEVFLPGGKVVSGQDLLAIAVNEVLALCRNQGRPLTPVVINDATSYRVKEVARRHGVEAVEVEVGEINVVLGMEQHRAWIGGEGSNGGVIFPPTRVRDGTLMMLAILKLLAERQTTDLQGLIDREYPRYYTPRAKVECAPAQVAPVRRRLVEALANRPWVERIQQTGDTTGGIKALAADESWLFFRESKTEAGQFRIFADARDEERARQLLREGEALFECLKQFGSVS